MTDCRALLAAVRAGHRPSDDEAMVLARATDPAPLLETADALARQGHGRRVSYSRKVFIPLTQLCRDVCHYCTFAQAPKRGRPAYLSPEQVLSIARAGRDAGCKEALFTLGDKPELRYRAARDGLAALGHDTTLSYLEAMARLVLDETGLLPHLNPGVMTRDEIARLRPVSASMGVMLESSAPRLCEKGGPHWGSPDKRPVVRLATLEAAGALRVPFTSGLLIGIGETRAERIEALLALRDLHARYGHIQEIIIQNFRAKPGTRMADAPEPSLDEQLWTIAVARVLFGPDMNIQAPPNLQPVERGALLRAGINDWGGVSPVTPDHVNPEAPWPHLDELARLTAGGGRTLVERLAIYPEYLQAPETWLDPALRTPVLQLVDGEGLGRDDTWKAGAQSPVPASPAVAIDAGTAGAAVTRAVTRACCGEDLSEDEVVALFTARGPDVAAVVAAADRLRAETVGDAVTYVVNRNINYTNVCLYRCGFCAFSKGRTTEALRGRPYDLAEDEIARRVAEAWQRGATEVCLQGGVHPHYNGETYLKVLDVVKGAAPDIHVHAFSPLEVTHGARTLGLSLTAFLKRLKAAGLASLPGTAAEILDDEVRQVICPDKVNTAEWLEVMETAHGLGLRTTATVMFGHVEAPQHLARHLLRVRGLQSRTGGFTEFVPLPFVHMEAPIWLKGQARPGPTFREAVLMHAVARLVLHPLVPNIQTSWVKMGPDGAAHCLAAGANDLGGVLMNESITRAAGAAHGQEMSPARLESIIRDLGRVPRQRNTLYGAVADDRRLAAWAAGPMTPTVETPLSHDRHAAE